MVALRSVLGVRPFALALLSLTLALSCTAPSPPTGQCRYDSDCSDGQICQGTYCRATCRATTDCPTGQTCQERDGARACVPMGTPGSCSFASDCPTGQICTQDGVCRPPCLQNYDCEVINPFTSCRDSACVLVCPAGRGDCNVDPVDGCETDLRSPLHCGACGTVCTAPEHGVSSCGPTGCTFTCEPGFGDCDGDATNGCEADLSRPDHCGACGNACAGASPLCTVSVTGGMRRASCAVACSGETPDRCGDSCVNRVQDPGHCGACDNRCPGGPRGAAVCVEGACVLRCDDATAVGDCDGVASNGCETDVTSAAPHCGTCGNTCPAAPNSTPACMAGACAVVCAAGFGNCDGSAPNGCEVDLAASPAHCGACGTACPARPNATATCADSRCGATCNAGFADCDGDPANGCEVELATAPAHCGACGSACSVANGVAGCAAGACTLARCNDGFGDCDGDPTNGCETNLTTNATHCGACGTRCSFPGAGARCSAGRCESTQVCMPSTLGDCDGNASNGCETDLLTSSAHCGNCGAACALPNAESSCTSGRCAVASCAAGTADCNAAAADGCEVVLGTSVLHCGACGRACSLANATAACTGGSCTIARCNAGFGDCDGDPANGCETNLATAPAHCGRCGGACGAINGAATCAAGACGITCAAGYGNCDGSLVNGCETLVTSSNAHCGRCNNACGAGFVCSAGVCGSVCGSGTTFCSGACVNTQTSPANCGACGVSCPGAANATATCASGACSFRCSAGFGDCDGSAANGCETSFATSPAHCGGCGNACNATNGTPSCAAGACGITCAAGFGNCDGSAANGCEVDLRNTVTSCGSCGAACSLPNATPACASSACAVSSCTTGFANCDAVASNGCEVDQRSDVRHCGGCGRACSATNGSPTCSAGTCGITCSAGFGNCDLSAANGCEVNTGTTLAHCGGCGRACSLANATPVCTAGACAVSSCAAGFGNCDGVASNGCEANFATSAAHCGRCGSACSAGFFCAGGTCTRDCGSLTNCSNVCVNVQTDAANCGGCGTACSYPNATGVCAAATCSLGACNAGFGNCDRSVLNGCETSTNTSLAHCGGCGQACAPANATGVCTAGACGIAACAAGWGNCDGAVGNGCEVNTTSSVTHCGACGNACTAPADGVAVCVSSVCDFTCNAGYYRVGTQCVGIPNPRQLAPLSTATTTTQRPTFTWVNAAGFTEARIQLCAQRSCATVSQTADVTGSSWTPTANLARGVWFWRVAGRTGTNVGLVYSPVWEVIVPNVGVTARAGSFGALNDVNGDGYTDLVVGSNQGENVYVYLGSATGLPSSASQTLTGTTGSRFGYAVEAAGDVNGDGYGDVIIGLPGASSARVYRGSAAGLTAAGFATLSVSGITGFGGSVSWAGDVDGDGYGDVVVGACWSGAACASRAYVFRGSIRGPIATPHRTYASTQTNFGRRVRGLGLSNNNDLADIAVGSDNAISVYYDGGTSAGTSIPVSSFTDFDSAWDVNNDGYADLVWGQRITTVTVAQNVYVHHGSASGYATTPSTTSRGSVTSYGVWVAGLGDVDGDGFGDVLYSFQGNTAVVRYGSAAGLATRALALTGTTTTGYGRGVSRIGDTNRDGYFDAWVGDPDWSGEFLCSDEQRIHRGASGTITAAPSHLITPVDNGCRDYSPSLE